MEPMIDAPGRCARYRSRGSTSALPRKRAIRIYARIETRVLEKQRCFDFGRLRGRRLSPNQRNGGGKIVAHLNRKRISDTPPKQNPTTPILPVQSGRAFSHRAAATKSSVIFCLSTCRNSSPPFSSFPG